MQLLLAMRMSAWPKSWGLSYQETHLGWAAIRQQRPEGHVQQSPEGQVHPLVAQQSHWVAQTQPGGECPRASRIPPGPCTPRR